jgi:hypothetical protein
MQRSVDNLGSSMTELLNNKASLEEFVYRFRSTNQKYYRIKETAKEVVNRFWSQALREPDKKVLLSIVLSAVIETLRQNPERYNIIFGNNSNKNNDNNNQGNINTYEQQDAVLEVSAKLSKALIERLVNETIETLESQTEADVESEDTQLDAAEDLETESMDKEVAAKVDNTEAASAEEEETKLEEE